uniref:Uncharacterized protein n=1 Tax=Oryzias melastigma TaxID=30732 RepID=A0A3B3D3H2_ORYME
MSYTGEVEPFDGALVIVTADHLAVRNLFAQAVGGLVGIDGKVHRRGVPLLLGLSEPLADGRLESRLSLLRWRRGRRFEARSGPGDSWTLERRSIESQSIWRDRFSTSSVIWVTTWIFSSPSSWLLMRALCSWICRRFL